MTQPFQAQVRSLRDQRILEVAEDRLVARGCVLFSVDEVAALVGVARGTVYLHFPGRTALISRVLQRTAGRGVDLLEEALGRWGPSAVLRAVGDFAKANLAHASRHRADAGSQQLCYPCCLRQVQCPFGENDLLTSTLTAALDRARADGQLGGAWWTSANLARWIRVVLGDLLVRTYEGDPSAIEHEIDMAIELLERGIGSPPAANP